MEADPARYSAFISYSHRDSRQARALQRSIESYRLPRALRGAARLDPRRGGRLKPVFRDRDELTAAPDLTASVRAALAASDHVIVVCTPHGAASAWVGREIALFRSLHPDRSVLAALFAGEAAEAFHPALRAGVGGGGTISPLAADFRRGGDGRLALLKLIAALADVPLDALVHRDGKRRLRQFALLALLAFAILAAIGWAALVARSARADARREAERGIATVAELVSQREQFSKAGRLDLLRQHDRAALNYFAGQDIAALPPRAQLLSAELLQGIGADSETAGDTAALAAAATAAWRTTAALLRAAPDDPERLLAHAQSEYWRGMAAWRLGRLDAARRHFAAYAALADRLVALGPRKAAWLREAGDADSNLATFLLGRDRNLDGAEPLYRRAQARFEAALERSGGYDRQLEIDIADGYGWLADVRRLKGDDRAALAYRTDQRRVLEAMLARHPDDAAIESLMIKNRLGLARVDAAGRRWGAAIAGFERGRAEAQAAARRDRTNGDIARQLRAFDLFEVRAWLDMPPALRPPAARIGSVLGDCARERAAPRNAETADFCTILEARLLASQGATDQAERLLRDVEQRPRPRALSERWRLDFKEEIGRARNARR